MGGMFEGATSFNGDLSRWDTSKAIEMGGMFRDATSFNGDISDWDTSKVIHMDFMFRDATSFNGDLATWDVSEVTANFQMFDGAPIGDDPALESNQPCIPGGSNNPWPSNPVGYPFWRP